MLDLDLVDVTDEDLLRKAIDSKVWFHSVKINEKLITKGQKTFPTIQQELKALSIPPLANKSVLDIGAYDGFYSFEAEKMGASKVVALDYYAWQVETHFSQSFLRDCEMKGTEPAPPYKTEWLYWTRDPVGLPGKKKFDLLRRTLQSRVQPIVADIMSIDIQQLGRFDVVFFMGVLYHLEDPLRGLRKVSSLTKEVAIIETEAMEIVGQEKRSISEFFPFDELNGDPSNWWVPNARCLVDMCRAAGFKEVKVVQGCPYSENVNVGDQIRYRAIVHAFK